MIFSFSAVIVEHDRAPQQALIAAVAGSRAGPTAAFDVVWDPSISRADSSALRRQAGASISPAIDAARDDITDGELDDLLSEANAKRIADAIDRTERDGRTPSDHYPVTAELELKK